MKVLKFGGTSMQHLDKVVSKIKLEENPCVVVSSIGKTTDLLCNKNIESVKQCYLDWASGYNVESFIKKFWEEVSLNIEAKDDYVMSAGERCAAKVLSLILGVTFFDDIIVEGPMSNAKIKHINIPKQLHKDIIIIPGFYGYDNGEIKTIGRSGSDITAGEVARFFNCKEVIIYTDVKGIYTADPRKVPSAKLLTHINRWDAIELGYAGGNVLHPRTSANLLGTNITIWVRSLLDDCSGTQIDETSVETLSVACLDDQQLVTIEKQDINGIPGIASDLFLKLAALNYSVSLITQSCSECCISFTTHECNNLSVMTEVIEKRKVGIITLVGTAMKNKVGIAATLFNAIANCNINVLAISQGSTERSISFVVDRNDTINALNCCHEAFISS